MSIFYSLINLFFMFLRVSDNRQFPPPLKREEEQELFRKYKKDGDLSARNKLIEHNLRLVSHIIKRYYSDAKEQDDLVSIGTIGLIKAIDSYNIEKGTRFATYAGKCLQNEILMYFRSQKKLNNEVSINESVDIDGEGNPLTYMDIIAVEDTIADDIGEKIECMKALKALSEDLTAREREIVVMRYGLGGRKEKTQREIAMELNISRSYVSRIEKAALLKIKEKLSENSIFFK
ncbi:MAG: RNA polymerase sporulation sigma factor SigK [Clostridia bacterium]|nr:RNA polymerase sporulation sigma factor SigK [Clostridia bacterium]